MWSFSSHATDSCSWFPKRSGSKISRQQVIPYSMSTSACMETSLLFLKPWTHGVALDAMSLQSPHMVKLYKVQKLFQIP